MKNSRHTYEFLIPSSVGCQPRTPSLVVEKLDKSLEEETRVGMVCVKEKEKLATIYIR